MKRIFKPILFILAVAYFLVDVIFLTWAKPLGEWIAEWKAFEGLKAWIVSLRPYPTLALFLAPFIVLEPVKPLAAYLAATGHMMPGLGVFVVGELLKLVLLERLFEVSRHKLMSIAAFAWAYEKYDACRSLVEDTEAWQLMRRWILIAKYSVRAFIHAIRISRRDMLQSH